MQYLPLLAVLGMGLSLSNSRAVWHALTGRQNSFLRTPKFRVEKTSDLWQESAYRLPLNPQLLAELSLLLYALVVVGVAISLRNYTTAFFMLLYASGFGLSLGIELEQAWSVRQIVRLQLFPSPVRLQKDHISVE